jgi:hypothetical protein
VIAMSESRMALVVGIDNYQHINPLSCCISDAIAVNNLLERNGDAAHLKNFDTKLLIGSGDKLITRSTLKNNVEQLFKANVEIALFYFAGHGYIESSGGYIITSECTQGDEGLSLRTLVNIANASPARNKIIILDSCFSGAAGEIPNLENHSAIADGVTILTASKRDEPSAEIGNHGVFTNLLLDALKGSAANLTGDITPGSIYAHIDQSLGAWEQRPVFKTNTERFVSLRKVTPPIAIEDLRRISEFFPSEGYVYQLDPSYEPRNEGRTSNMPPSNPENNAIFAILQKYNHLNLLIPVNANHMWNAAMESTGCKLTMLGEHYRRLATQGTI